MDEDGNYIFDPIMKDAGTTRSVQLDLYTLIVKEWQPNREVTAGEILRPLEPNGYSILAMTDGLTAGQPTRVPATLDELYKDGSVTWKVQAADAFSLLSADTPVCVSDPLGLTIGNVSISGSRYLLATYSGGTLENDYDAVFTLNIGGQPTVFRQKVQVRKQ